MAVTTVKTVDFIPNSNILGDLDKISEYNFAIKNSKIIPVITLICMEKGSNALIPEMGIHELLMSLPYKEIGEVYNILEQINNHIIRFTGYTTRTYIDEANPENDFKKGHLVIRIDVEGVLNPINIGINKSKTFYVKHPSVFMKDF
jgi:hypothetical protein